MKAFRCGTSIVMLAACACILIALPGRGQISDDELITHGGDWVRDYQFRPIAKQADPEASGRIVSPAVKGTTGAWRCTVEPGPSCKGAGIVVLADADGTGGLECLMGGTGEMRGFLLRTANGKVLWQDAWAPWIDYEPCIVEVVVEPGRVRAQLLHFDGETLISQSEWVEVDKALAAEPGLMGLMTDKGIGRFWGWRIADKPLAAATPDAPNKRRIVPGEEWAIVGPMTWQWKTARREVVRQTANVERAWLLNKNIRGAHRTWTCKVRVSPPSGGAGLVFQGGEDSKSGFLAWLGGTYGNGCLILYDLSKGYRGAIWSGPQGKWKYNTAYTLVGETKPGHVRAKLLAEDGKTVLSESPWRKYDAAVTDRAGVLGFHTWKGPSEFWGFAGATEGLTGEGDRTKASADASDEGFQRTRVNGTLHLVHAGAETHRWLNASRAGTHGLWRARLTPKGDGTFDLLFQASDRGTKGFVARLAVQKGKGTLRLLELPERTLWYSKPVPVTAGATYVLEGMSTTDRVRARLYAGDGKKLLADSDQHYVSDKHNARKGCLGVRASGDVEFFDLSFAPEK